VRREEEPTRRRRALGGVTLGRRAGAGVQAARYRSPSPVAESRRPRPCIARQSGVVDALGILRGSAGGAKERRPDDLYLRQHTGDGVELHAVRSPSAAPSGLDFPPPAYRRSPPEGSRLAGLALRPGFRLKARSPSIEPPGSWRRQEPRQTEFELQGQVAWFSANLNGRGATP